MTDDSTAIHVHQDEKEALDAAADDLFATRAVAYRTVIHRLLSDHDDVDYE